MKMSEQVCLFCRSSEVNELEFGELITQGDITVHYFCLLLSSGLNQNGKPSDKKTIKGFVRQDILREHKRGKRLRCFFCHVKGATLGCCNGKCRKAFHLPCGRKNGTLHHFFHAFRSYCEQHRPIQSISSSDRLSFHTTCAICLFTVDTKSFSNALCSRCCKKSWFHKLCIQRYALSAGKYFFKCPLCNCHEDFQKEMLDLGIYIPDQDASWERQPDAFNDLLERHSTCDAPTCKCSQGRDYDAEKGLFDLLLCQHCGSFGSHKACRGLARVGIHLLCPICAEIATSMDQSKARSLNEAIVSSSKIQDCEDLTLLVNVGLESQHSCSGNCDNNDSVEPSKIINVNCQSPRVVITRIDSLFPIPKGKINLTKILRWKYDEKTYSFEKRRMYVKTGKYNKMGKLKILQDQRKNLQKSSLNDVVLRIKKKKHHAFIKKQKVIQKMQKIREVSGTQLKLDTMWKVLCIKSTGLMKKEEIFDQQIESNQNMTTDSNVKSVNMTSEPERKELLGVKKISNKQVKIKIVNALRKFGEAEGKSDFQLSCDSALEMQLNDISASTGQEECPEEIISTVEHLDVFKNLELPDHCGSRTHGKVSKDPQLNFGVNGVNSERESSLCEKPPVLSIFDAFDSRARFYKTSDLAPPILECQTLVSGNAKAKVEIGDPGSTYGIACCVNSKEAECLGIEERVNYISVQPKQFCVPPSPVGLSEYNGPSQVKDPSEEDTKMEIQPHTEIPPSSTSSSEEKNLLGFSNVTSNKILFEVANNKQTGISRLPDAIAAQSDEHSKWANESDGSIQAHQTNPISPQSRDLHGGFRDSSMFNAVKENTSGQPLEVLDVGSSVLTAQTQKVSSGNNLINSHGRKKLYQAQDDENNVCSKISKRKVKESKMTFNPRSSSQQSHCQLSKAKVFNQQTLQHFFYKKS